MKQLQSFQAIIEYLAGARDEAPEGFKLPLNSLLWGGIWVVLMGFIVLFSGQASKFIYIDF